MLISSNPMTSVLHNIMWSIGKNVIHKAKGKIVYLIEPWWTKMYKNSTPNYRFKSVINNHMMYKSCMIF